MEGKKMMTLQERLTGENKLPYWYTYALAEEWRKAEAERMKKFRDGRVRKIIDLQEDEE